MILRGRMCLPPSNIAPIERALANARTICPKEWKPIFEVARRKSEWQSRNQIFESDVITSHLTLEMKNPEIIRQIMLDSPFASSLKTVEKAQGRPVSRFAKTLDALLTLGGISEVSLAAFGDVTVFSLYAIEGIISNLDRLRRFTSVTLRLVTSGWFNDGLGGGLADPAIPTWHSAHANSPEIIWPTSVTYRIDVVRFEFADVRGLEAQKTWLRCIRLAAALAVSIGGPYASYLFEIQCLVDFDEFGSRLFDYMSAMYRACFFAEIDRLLELHAGDGFSGCKRLGKGDRKAV